jgi:hypothetical protein
MNIQMNELHAIGIHDSYKIAETFHTTMFQGHNYASKNIFSHPYFDGHVPNNLKALKTNVV